MKLLLLFKLLFSVFRDRPLLVFPSFFPPRDYTNYFISILIIFWYLIIVIITIILLLNGLILYNIIFIICWAMLLIELFASESPEIITINLLLFCLFFCAILIALFCLELY